MSIIYNIETFDKNVTAPVNDLAMLHRKLLPWSPVAELGDRFMKRFYYNDLPKAGYIFGAIAYVDKLPVGFISATHDSNGFMRSAMQKLWWRLILEVGINSLFYPKSILSILKAARITESRKTKSRAQLEGEILSLGVLPDYTDFRYIHKTGLRIANDLLHRTMVQLQTKEIKLVRAYIFADSPSTQLFYHGQGWKIERSNISGWKAPVVEFVWRK